MRRLTIALAVFALVLGARSPQAEACSCISPEGITYPTFGAIDVPVNARILFVAFAGNTPTFTAYYDGDPSLQIPGTAVLLGAHGSNALWAFEPAAPFDPGRLVTGVLDVGFLLTRDFTTGTVSDGTPPIFAGLLSTAAAEETVVSTVGFPLCSAPPSLGQIFKTLDLDYVDATDDTTPDDSLVYRYFIYDTPGQMPSVPELVSSSWWRFRKSPCAGMTICAPVASFSFGAGETVCVRVEVEDAAGNNIGYSAEACTQARGIDIDVDANANVCTEVPPSPPDAGVPDAGVPDAGGGVDAGAPDGSSAPDAAPPGPDGGPDPNDAAPPGPDAGSSPDAGGNPTNPTSGCSCRSESSDGGLGGCLLILFLLGLRRRRDG